MPILEKYMKVFEEKDEAGSTSKNFIMLTKRL